MADYTSISVATDGAVTTLAIARPDKLNAITPTVFAELPRLLERAGPGREGTKGSITGLFAVLVEGDDHNEPIADAARLKEIKDRLYDRGLDPGEPGSPDMRSAILTYEKEAALDSWGALLVSFAVIGFASSIGAKTKLNMVQYGFAHGMRRVRHGLNALGIDRSHLLHDLKKTV